MRIQLDIPDSVIQGRRAIHVLAGIEHIAYKMPWDDHWHVKTQVCSRCGRCCKKAKCEYLEQEPGTKDKWRCNQPMNMPYTCLISRPRKVWGCTMKFKKVK